MADALPTPDANDREAGFDAVLVLVLEAEDAGQPRDLAHWLAHFPEYRSELLEYFADRANLPGSLAGDRAGALPEFPGHEVVRELGRGGMGVVYEARQLDPPRVVALKALPTARLRTPVERVRFRREAQVAARLDHPGIVPVYMIGEADGVPFYTMRLAPGGPLSRALDRYTADPRATARLVADLARAVHHAHQHAVLHRDLKPSNILLDADGRGCVADFGLVRDLADPDPITRTADLVGTPPYMAPEQTRGQGEPCTVATDVYGLGCVLYTCLTGRPPFTGSNPAAVLLQVQQSDPEPPARVNPRVPRDLDAVCRMCLEKVPARRYASGAELAADLDRFVNGAPVRAKPIGPARRAARWVRRHPLPAALATLAALALLTACGVGAWAWDRDRKLGLAQRDAERNRFFAGLERVRQRRDDPYASWSGQSLADLRELAALGPARDHLAELRSEVAAALAAADLGPGPLLADFPAYATHYSADDRWLAVAGWTAGARGRVELTDRTTNARRDLTFPVDAKWQDRAGRPDGARCIRFSPDARWLVVGTRSGWLVRWDMTDLDAGPYAWPGHTEDHAEPRFVAVTTAGFTADGRTLLSGSLGATRGWTVADGRTTGLVLKGCRLPADFYPIEDEMAVYGPDGRAGEYGVLRVGRREFIPDRRFDGIPAGCLGPDPWLMAYQPDGRTGVCVRYAHPFSRPRPLQRWEDVVQPSHMAFSPTGDLLAAVYEHDLRLRVWDVSGGVLLAERTTDREVTHVAFSPDGCQLAVSGMTGVRAYPVPRRLLETVAVVAEPEIASVSCPSDHSRVVALSHVPGMAAKCYQVPLTHARPVPVVRPELLTLDRLSRWTDVAPDGRGFVLSGTAGENVLQDETGARLMAADLSDVRFGPDGRLWVLQDHHLRIGSVSGGAPVAWRNDPASESAGAALKCVAPGPDFTLVGRRDGRVFRLGPVGGEEAAWPVVNGAVLGLAIGAGGGRAAAGGERGEVHLLDAGTGAVTPIPDAHRAAVPAVVFGPNFLVTGSADRRVRLWTPAGEPIATLTMRGPVAKVLVSTDGSSLLVHVQGERAVRRWRLDVLFREWEGLGLGTGLPPG